MMRAIIALLPSNILTVSDKVHLLVTALSRNKLLLEYFNF